MAEEKLQKLILTGRTDLTVQAVKDVIEFDESKILLDTELGVLNVDGEGMRITALDLQARTVTIAAADIVGAYFTDREEKSKKGFVNT